MLETKNLQWIHCGKACGSVIKRILGWHGIKFPRNNKEEWKKGVLKDKLLNMKAHQKRPFTPGKYSFSNVRNPWSWWVSSWTYACLGRGDEYLTTKNGGKLNLLSKNPNNRKKFEKWVKWRISKGYTLTKDFIACCNGAIENVDHVVKCETIREDMIKVLTESGSNLKKNWIDILDKILSVPENSTSEPNGRAVSKIDGKMHPHDDWRTFYTDDFKRYVYEHEKYIFENFYHEDFHGFTS